jgi:acyl carrier protein
VPAAGRGGYHASLVPDEKQQEIEGFIVNELQAGSGLESLRPDEDLLAADLIDSLGITQLVTFLEKNYGITVTDDQLTPENFQTIERIAALVDRR